MRGWVHSAWLAAAWWLLVVALSLAPTAAAQRPQSELDIGPVVTPKQQREFLHWNYSRVQRDIRRLVELAQEASEQAEKLPGDPLPDAQRQSIEALREKIAALSQAFEKTNANILPLGIVGRAHTVEAEAKSLRESFKQGGKRSRELSHLQGLTRQIQEHAKQVAERLRQP